MQLRPILHRAIWSSLVLLLCLSAQGQSVPSVLAATMYVEATAPAGYDADAQAFIDECSSQGVTLSTTQQDAVNQLVVDLKAAGIWTKFYALYPMVGASANSHKLNLKDPRDLDAAYRLTFAGGSITHSSTGVVFVSGRYANTHLNANTVLPDNNWHLSFYAATTGASGWDIGCFQSSPPSHGTMMGIRTSSTAAYPQNSASFSGSATGNSLFTLTRTSVSRADIYRLSTSVGNQTATTSFSNPPYEVYLGAYSNGSPQSYSGRTCSFASIGESFNGTEMSAFAAAVQDYQNALGRKID